ncbi:MAG TPA: hypothetical protein VNQ56_08195 [Pseudolabrys sp.]|nr:hypothetical protein [Pseudolabrys sp.]
MTTPIRDDPFAVLEDARIATVLRRLHGEANRQHLSIIRHFLPHVLSYVRRRFIPFAENEMAGFYADKYIAIIEAQGAFAYLTARAHGGRVRHVLRTVDAVASCGSPRQWRRPRRDDRDRA